MQGARAQIYAEVSATAVGRRLSLTAPHPDCSALPLDGNGAKRPAGPRRHRLYQRPWHLADGRHDRIGRGKACSRAIARLMGSTKSAIGNLRRRRARSDDVCSSRPRPIVPPTLNLYNPDEDTEASPVPALAKKRKVKAALNTASFGGTNASVSSKSAINHVLLCEHGEGTALKGVGVQRRCVHAPPSRFGCHLPMLRTGGTKPLSTCAAMLYQPECAEAWRKATNTKIPAHAGFCGFTAASTDGRRWCIRFAG